MTLRAFQDVSLRLYCDVTFRARVARDPIAHLPCDQLTPRETQTLHHLAQRDSDLEAFRTILCRKAFRLGWSRLTHVAQLCPNLEHEFLAVFIVEHDFSARDSNASDFADFLCRTSLAGKVPTPEWFADLVRFDHVCHLIQTDSDLVTFDPAHSIAIAPNETPETSQLMQAPDVLVQGFDYDIRQLLDNGTDLPMERAHRMFAFVPPRADAPACVLSLTRTAQAVFDAAARPTTRDELVQAAARSSGSRDTPERLRGLCLSLIGELERRSVLCPVADANA